MEFTSKHFCLLQLLFCLLLWCHSTHWVECRPDGDTEKNNESFKDLIKHLHDEEEDCKIKKENGDFVTATAKVAPPFVMPTCMKEFYTFAHLPGCGKPMYNKFKYCAKALFTGNLDYEGFDFNKLWEMEKKFLVLFDGCLNCLSWPERAANLSLILSSGIEGQPNTTTEVDKYGKFKIGAIFTIKNKKGMIRSFSPTIVIEHQCNQYGMLQTKTVELPVIYPQRMYQLTYEQTSMIIELIQKGKKEVTVKWGVDEKNAKKNKNGTDVAMPNASKPDTKKPS